MLQKKNALERCKTELAINVLANELYANQKQREKQVREIMQERKDSVK